MIDTQNYLLSWEEYESGDTGLSLLEGLEEVKKYLSIKFGKDCSDVYKGLTSCGIWFGEYFEVSMSKTNWVDKTKHKVKQ
ncbi:Hypothetical protein DAL_116 [Psychrobacter phage D'Alembert]|nr:Hypothetical protein DAL_116 [Psychrobacter phage D'Alembert]